MTRRAFAGVSLGAAAAQTTRRAPKLEHRYAHVNGIRMHYVAAGRGPLMLFLHGFPEFWYAWKNQLTEFGKDHLAVAPDLRGYNLTSKPADVEQYQMKFLVEDVRSLAESLGAKRFTLSGHDWGGVVAWMVAINHPDMVEKLVIVNAPHPGIFRRELRENAAQQKASQYMHMFRSPQAEQTLSTDNYAFLQKIVLGNGLANGYFTEQDRKAYLKAWSQPGALTGGLNYYRAARVGPPLANDPPPSANSKEILNLTVTPPTLVIWGEKDTALLASNLEGLDQYVRKLTIKRIPDGTHWVIHEQPLLINRYIREFIGA